MRQDGAIAQEGEDGSVAQPPDSAQTASEGEDFKQDEFQDGEDSDEEWLPREAAAVSRSLATAASMLYEEDMSQLEGSDEREGMEAQEQEEALMHNLTDSPAQYSNG